MLGRYFLVGLGLIALLWTGYLSVQLIDSKDNLSPLNLFGIEDGKLLVVNRPEELDLSFVEFSIPEKSNNLINSLVLKENFSNLIISENRDHFLIIGKERWNKSLVRSLFENAPNDLPDNSITAFNSGPFHVRTEKNRIYVNLDVQQTKLIEGNWFLFDRKSSATLFDLTDKVKRNDIYFKTDGQIQYKAQLAEKIQGNQVDDRELFAHVLPQGLTNYHFTEKEYLISIDPIFKESPMSHWVDKGIVEFDFQGKHVIVTDFIDNQDPVNSLFDFMKQDPLNQQYGYFKNLKLTQEFPVSLSKGFYAYSMDDYVVMCQDQQICEKVVAAYKLGNTLILKEDQLASIYGSLPGSVTVREIKPSSKITKTFYRGHLFQTLLTTSGSQDSGSKTSKDEYASYKAGAEIHDFATLNGKGNLFITTSNGNLIYFQNGKRQWERYLGSKPVGNISIVEVNGRQICVVCTKSSVHALDQQGNPLNGYPFIAADKQIISGPSTFLWRGKLNVVYLNAMNEMIRIDQGGKKISSFPTGMEQISELPVAWVSQRKLFLGVWNADKFKMIDAERNREYRSFAVIPNSKLIKGDGEIFLTGIRGDELVLLDQKGSQKALLKGLTDFKLERVVERKGSNDIFVSNGKMYKVISKNGNVLSEVQFEGKNIGFLDGFMGNSGNSCVLAFDDLENDVYLYALNGQKISKGKYQGMKKAIVSNLILTTIVDDFVVQYEL
ncbi:MAG: hypothetical protein EP305_07100 [Bacteroidetes bacterium]|nr:MAG: hypothetical protein EP305_07100 [Bacteroidota bacterium]